MSTSHDQNFKTLILDYPREALAFFAPSEAAELADDDTVLITPIRQEQLKARLADHVLELDVPLLVEWSDGRREALLFAVEEESDPYRFSVHRLVRYCLALSETFKTTRVVPVVIFLKGSRNVPRLLELRSERDTYLHFHYIACVLPEIPAQEHMHSNNVVARLNLPNMLWSPAQKVDVYGQAIRGLLSLEPDPNRQMKYFDFIDIYLQLDDNERQIYAERYPQEVHTMETWSERQLKKGLQQGLQQGREQGREEGRKEHALHTLDRVLSKRFGALDATALARLQSATLVDLDQWLDRALDAGTLQEVFRDQ